MSSVFFNLKKKPITTGVTPEENRLEENTENKVIVSIRPSLTDIRLLKVNFNESACHIKEDNTTLKLMC